MFGQDARSGNNVHFIVLSIFDVILNHKETRENETRRKLSWGEAIWRWMDGRTNRRMDGRTDKQTNGRTDKRTDRRTDQPTDEVSYRGAYSRLKIKTKSVFVRNWISVIFILVEYAN
jgi:hypothetical protein